MNSDTTTILNDIFTIEITNIYENIYWMKPINNNEVYELSSEIAWSFSSTNYPILNLGGCDIINISSNKISIIKKDGKYIIEALDDINSEVIDITLKSTNSDNICILKCKIINIDNYTNNRSRSSQTTTKPTGTSTESTTTPTTTASSSAPSITVTPTKDSNNNLDDDVIHQSKPAVDVRVYLKNNSGIYSEDPFKNNTGDELIYEYDYGADSQLNSITIGSPICINENYAYPSYLSDENISACIHVECKIEWTIADENRDKTVYPEPKYIFTSFKYNSKEGKITNIKIDLSSINLEVKSTLKVFISWISSFADTTTTTSSSSTTSTTTLPPYLSIFYNKGNILWRNTKEQFTFDLSEIYGGNIYINIENFDDLSKELNKYNLKLLKNKKYLKDDGNVEHLKVDNINIGTGRGSFILNNLSEFLVNIVEGGESNFKLLNTDLGHLLYTDSIDNRGPETYTTYHMIDEFRVIFKENGYLELSNKNVELTDIKYANIVNSDRDDSYIIPAQDYNVTDEVNNAFNFLMNSGNISTDPIPKFFNNLLLDNNKYIYTNNRKLYSNGNRRKFTVKSAYKNDFIVNFTKTNSNGNNHIEDTSDHNIYEYITNIQNGFNNSTASWNEWIKIAVSCDVILNLVINIDKISKELTEYTNGLFENVKDKNINLPKNNLGILQFIKIE